MWYKLIGFNFYNDKMEVLKGTDSVLKMQKFIKEYKHKKYNDVCAIGLYDDEDTFIPCEYIEFTRTKDNQIIMSGITLDSNGYPDNLEEDDDKDQSRFIQYLAQFAEHDEYRIYTVVDYEYEDRTYYIGNDITVARRVAQRYKNSVISVDYYDDKGEWFDADALDVNNCFAK